MIRAWVRAWTRQTCWTCLVALLAAASMAAHAQDVPVATPADTSAAPPADRPAFDLQVDAPEEMADYLARHLELQRYRELADLDDNELDRLLAAADTNARELLGTLGYFSPTLRFEHANAPADAKVQRHVRLHVAPGPQAMVSEVTIDFDGAIAADADARGQRGGIRGGWLLRPGNAFTQAEWDAAKNDALRRLTDRRYPAGRISASQAEVDPATATVRLSLTLDSGPRYRIGALQVEGSDRYDPALVSRLARLSPGDDYNQTKLLEAQQRLSDSGYFDSVFLSVDTKSDPNQAPVRVQLREARRQKLVFGVGASTDSGARLSVEHTHHRVPGLDWRAVTKASHDRNKQQLGTELTAPPDAHNWRWATSVLLQHEQAASYQVTSQRLRVGRTQLGERIDRNTYLQYDRARTTGATGSVLADAVSANYAWTRRHFNTVPYPTDGYGLGVELGGGTTLGNQPEPFGRVAGRWLGYLPLDRSESGRAITRAGRLALRAEGGAVLARQDVTLPTTQLFLTGGDTSVRGYALHEIGVRRPTGETAPGRYLAVGSIELQRPISVDRRVTAWEGTAFIDAGAVADRPAGLQAKVGVGVGARWRSPVGPLQIDLAYGVDTRRVRLHLNVGFTF